MIVRTIILDTILSFIFIVSFIIDLFWYLLQCICIYAQLYLLVRKYLWRWDRSLAKNGKKQFVSSLAPRSINNEKCCIRLCFCWVSLPVLICLVCCWHYKSVINMSTGRRSSPHFCSGRVTVGWL